MDKPTRQTFLGLCPSKASPELSRKACTVPEFEGGCAMAQSTSTSRSDKRILEHLSPAISSSYEEGDARSGGSQPERRLP